MQGEKREVATSYKITEIRMELESSFYCVWIPGYLHFCVAEPAKPPLHKMHIMASMQD